MAKRNPDWSTDELLLAIDLYRRLGPLGDEHPEVKSLSALLRSANLTAASENESFRNPAGVSMKLQNIRYVDTKGAIGFVGGGKLERELWEMLSPDFTELTRMAAAIRTHISAGASLDGGQEDASLEAYEAFEGRILSYAHFRRERDAKLRRRKIESIKAKDRRLDCEACGFNFDDAYGERGADFIEVVSVRSPRPCDAPSNADCDWIGLDSVRLI